MCTFWEKKGALCWQRLCVLCRALFSFLFLFLFFFKVCMYNLVCVCVYILEERSWCSRSLFLLGLGRFSLYRDTRSLWRSLNTRGGCFRERKSKSTNPKARRFRASTSSHRVFSLSFSFNFPPRSFTSSSSDTESSEAEEEFIVSNQRRETR